MDGTPIFAIKPYLPYADAYPDALSGFAPDSGTTLRVEFAPDALHKFPEDKREALISVLANDPRPRYQHDPERLYAMDFAGYGIKFRVIDDCVEVTEVQKN